MKEKKDMENLTHTLRSQGKRRIPSDVMGSYTGNYDDELEKVAFSHFFDSRAF